MLIGVPLGIAFALIAVRFARRHRVNYRQPQKTQNLVTAASLSLVAQRRFVRVFVSSTFVDMQPERDALVRHVFPALRDNFRPRGVEITDIDLRWGITKEQAESDQILPICLAEIDRCRPFFLAIVGNRYGTEIDLPQSLTESYSCLRDIKRCGITECEIRYALSSGEMDGAVLFERIPSPEFPIIDDEPRLMTLKSELRSAGAVFIPYRSIEEFITIAQTTFQAKLDEIFPKGPWVDRFAQEANEHACFAFDFCALYVGRDRMFEAIDAWLPGPQTRLLIRGPEGAGKTALVANYLASIANRSDVVRFAHYCTATPYAADPETIVRRLYDLAGRIMGDETFYIFGGEGNLETRLIDLMMQTYENANGDVRIGVNIDNLEGAADKLKQMLVQAGHHAQKHNQIVLIALDGVEAIGERADCAWIPDDLPSSIKILITSSDAKTHRAALSNGWDVLEIVPLDEGARLQLITAKLKGWGRALSPERCAKILRNPFSSSPLFLTTLLNELRVSAVEAQLNSTIIPLLASRACQNYFRLCLKELNGTAAETSHHGCFPLYGLPASV